MMHYYAERIFFKNKTEKEQNMRVQGLNPHPSNHK
jgi:hypothetical protein